MKQLRGVGFSGGLGGFTRETDCPCESCQVQDDQRVIMQERREANSLVRFGSIFERTENVWVGTTFNAVDEVADLAEERIVIRERVYKRCFVSQQQGG